MDFIIQSWIYSMIYNDVVEATLRHTLRLDGIETQFLGNQETHTFFLHTHFCNFIQGDLSIMEYCWHFMNMADALCNLGKHVSDCTVVLNIIRCLNTALAGHMKCKRIPSHHSLRFTGICSRRNSP